MSPVRLIDYAMYSSGFTLVLIRYPFFFNDTAANEIYTLSLHDALPISMPVSPSDTASAAPPESPATCGTPHAAASTKRSEEHTSELQSRQYLVCRLLLEKNKTLANHRTKLPDPERPTLRHHPSTRRLTP